jgi:hypothetical protein
MEFLMDELIKIVDYSQIDESVGQAIETMQLPPDMADDLFAVLSNWLTDNDYEIVDEN